LITKKRSCPSKSKPSSPAPSKAGSVRGATSERPSVFVKVFVKAAASVAAVASVASVAAVAARGATADRAPASGLGSRLVGEAARGDDADEGAENTSPDASLSSPWEEEGSFARSALRQTAARNSGSAATPARAARFDAVENAESAVDDEGDATVLRSASETVPRSEATRDASVGAGASPPIRASPFFATALETEDAASASSDAAAALAAAAAAAAAATRGPLVASPSPSPPDPTSTAPDPAPIPALSATARAREAPPVTPPFPSAFPANVEDAPWPRPFRRASSGEPTPSRLGEPENARLVPERIARADPFRVALVPYGVGGNARRAAKENACGAPIPPAPYGE
jgi:hypothetical protein